VNSLLTGPDANSRSQEKNRILSSVPRSREIAGMMLALTAAVAFALTSTSARIAYDNGSNPLTVAAVRFLLPMTVLAVWLLLRGVPLKLPLWQRWAAVALGVVTAVYSWALLTAIAVIPVALAILVFYLFPFITAVILAVCGWGKLVWQTIVGIVLAFGGLALVLQPLGYSLNIGGVVLALVGAIGVAVVISVSSRIFGAGDSRRVTLHIAAVAAAMLIVICATYGEFALPRTGFGWFGFISTSAFYAFAIITFFIAISMIGPVRVSLLSYAEPVMAAVLSVAWLDEKLAPLQIIGISIVIVALVGSTVLRSSAH
jgi:drug/metabolite transporter (DMT)-like permease